MGLADNDGSTRIWAERMANGMSEAEVRAGIEERLQERKQSQAPNKNQSSKNYLTESVPGDANFTSRQQVAQRIAQIRKNRKLPPNKEHDEILTDLVMSGHKTIGDARTAITQLATADGHPDYGTGLVPHSGPKDNLGAHGYATTLRGLTLAPDTHSSTSRVIPTQQMTYDTVFSPEERLAFFDEAASNYPGGKQAFQQLSPNAQRARALSVANRHAREMWGFDDDTPLNVVHRDAMDEAKAKLAWEVASGQASRRVLNADAFAQPSWGQDGNVVGNQTMPREPHFSSSSVWDGIPIAQNNTNTPSNNPVNSAANVFGLNSFSGSSSNQVGNLYKSTASSSTYNTADTTLSSSGGAQQPIQLRVQLGDNTS